MKSTIQASEECGAERILSHQPEAIFLEFESAKWTMHKDLGRGIYPLRPTTRIWTVNEMTNIKARRKGFQIVPDYGNTAHSEQGASEPAAIVDCLQSDHVCKTTDSISSYIGITRVKEKEALLISEPFSPALFRQGEQEGPEMLMKVLDKKIDTDVANEKHRCSLFLRLSIIAVFFARAML